MPIINDFSSSISTKLAVWSIEESMDELRPYMPQSIVQKEELSLRKTEGGKKGYIAARLAVKSLGISLTDLSFTKQGEPQLTNGFCSLSHCQDYAVAVVGQNPIGVDVEAHREKIVRIASKFVHVNEYPSILPKDEIALLTRLWTAKEAVYKAMHHPGLALATQIEVAPFSLKDTTGEARVYLADKTHRFSLQFSTFKAHQLSIAQLITST